MTQAFAQFKSPHKPLSSLKLNQSVHAHAATAAAIYEEDNGDFTYAYLLVFVQPGNFFCGEIPANVSANVFGTNRNLIGGSDYKFAHEDEGEATLPACALQESGPS